MAVHVLQLGLDCQSCDEQLKRERGCKRQSIRAWYIDSKIYRRCPLKIIPSYIWDYFQAYSFYKKNILPQGKGWLQESQKFLDAMIIIDNEMAKLEQEQIDRQRKKRHGQTKG